ncbi:hypothetical protein tinsulaeT_29070 [Thalassotalea insulae]|uniref:CHAD domain-containing protein n=1 Tax=Thalassotalea insulae TaxID=2056778 RepID=A0ABQ6GW12_9GAMM|nr:hypothetical protein [Thalassotalea insulae]GLX79567.1 hypothetical protein tinsulaeT_29070 [Thalassotalea insulae]
MAGMQYLKSLFFTLLLMLSACSDPILEQVEKQTPITVQRVEQLASALEKGQVRNAKLINVYANKLRQTKPELSVLIDEFAKDATTQGPMYQALLDRLNTVKTQPQMFSSSQAIFDELLNIYQAADPVLYSDALSDPLNVLADMSDGQLPRVNALSKAQSAQANNAQDFGVGEQLIGNPNYGHWQTNSSGMSFWAWYGMYSMMDNLFGSRNRVYYDQWGRYRNYSYYNDYGRTRYSSPTQLRKQTQLDTRTRKSFASRGQKFTSAYSKNRTGSSSLSGQSKSAQTSAKRFASKATNKSTFAKKSSYSKNASFRNSASTTSRSFRRGK